MSDALNDFLRIRDQVDRLQRDADRADGAHRQAVKELQDLGYKTTKVAERRLGDLDEEIFRLEMELAKTVKELRQALDEGQNDASR